MFSTSWCGSEINLCRDTAARTGATAREGACQRKADKHICTERGEGPPLQPERTYIPPVETVRHSQ